MMPMLMPQAKRQNVNSKRRNKLRILVLSIFVLATSNALMMEHSQAQTLSRLFLTPLERAQLERQRLLANRPQAEIEVEAAPVAAVELPVLVEEEMGDVIYAHGGTMRRSNGSYTVWLNSQAVDQAALPENIQLLTPFAQGQLRITNPDTGQSFNVKPGQVLNLTAGELLESYQVQADPAPVASEVTQEDGINPPQDDGAAQQ